MVSIVVPVYKVEKYLQRCIESILNQTYKDLDVILVDDGSPDSCGEIAESFKLKDNRISVFHQENKGVSSARNLGLSAAKGKYVVFVDADDYVERDYIYNLVSAIQSKDNVQLGIINYSIAHIPQVKSYPGLYNQKQTAIRLFQKKGFMGYLFNKIFLIDIIRKNHITFSSDSSWCEDALFCSKYIMYTQYSCFVEYEGYNYCIRNDSATNMEYNEKHISVLDTYKQIINIMKELQYNDLDEQLKINYVVHCINLKRMLLRANKDNIALNKYLNRLLRANIKCLINKRMSGKDKVKYLLCIIGARI